MSARALASFDRKRRTLLRTIKASSADPLAGALSAWSIMADATRSAAKVQGWRPSELAATLADCFEDLARVFGAKIAKEAEAAYEAARGAK
jgi:hypothetical protein